MSSALATSLSTLTQIRQKARRLTGSYDESQLTTTDLDNYINTFILFDVPENVKFFNLRTQYEFYTDPNIEAYPFPRNDYINVYQPVYMAGYQGFFTQSREQFYRVYPQLQFSENVATGDGVTNSFNIQLSNFPVLRGYTYSPEPYVYSQVFLSYPDANGVSQIARDDGNGGFVNENGDVAMTGTINYTTGAITNLQFEFIPDNGSTITAQSIPYQASRPQALLFFNDTFILRPVPDKAYQISMEVLQRPTALLASNDNPELEEWWQYFAYGAAKKVLEDRQDMTSLANIMPGFKEQERLCLRRTSQQLTQERTATIFTEQVQFPFGNFFNRF